MKLKNKKTGEIKEVIVGGYPVSGKTKMWECSEMDANEETGYKSLGTYTSLAELNEEWQDYEEPKEYYYYIDEDGVIQIEQGLCSVLNMRKSIGNYFATKEEAEKACDKLRAWKRLKDKGFVFKGINMDDGSIKTGLSKGGSLDECEEFYCDMELLFGGEE